MSEPRSVGAEVSLRLRPGPASGGREVSPAQVCGTQRGTHRGDIKLEIGRLEPVVMTLIILGTGGVQGQGKGQRLMLMGIKAVNDSIGLATYQSKIYEK